jgi:hypothetical protein
MILTVVAVYLLAGLLFGVAFLAVGVSRIDPAARGTSVRFRLLILPGTIALWPILATKWAKIAKRSA